MCNTHAHTQLIVSLAGQRLSVGKAEKGEVTPYYIIKGKLPNLSIWTSLFSKTEQDESEVICTMCVRYLGTFLACYCIEIE